MKRSNPKKPPQIPKGRTSDRTNDGDTESISSSSSSNRHLTSFPKNDREHGGNKENYSIDINPVRSSTVTLTTTTNSSSTLLGNKPKSSMKCSKSNVQMNVSFTDSGIAVENVESSEIGGGHGPDALASLMNEKVASVANQIYQELDMIIKKYGEDAAKSIMPHIVTVLEQLDYGYTYKEELIAELELLKDDNEQLLTQYEREKKLHKESNQKCFQIEDEHIEKLKKIEDEKQKIDSLLRIYELRTKNAVDQLTRQEDRENDLKKENSKLYERYSELMKNHMDYMERTKILFGTDRLENINSALFLQMNAKARRENNMATSMMQTLDHKSPSDGEKTDDESPNNFGGKMTLSFNAANLSLNDEMNSERDMIAGAADRAAGRGEFGSSTGLSQPLSMKNDSAMLTAQALCMQRRKELHSRYLPAATASRLLSSSKTLPNISATTSSNPSNQSTSSLQTKYSSRNSDEKNKWDSSETNLNGEITHCSMDNINEDDENDFNPDDDEEEDSHASTISGPNGNDSLAYNNSINYSEEAALFDSAANDFEQHFGGIDSVDERATYDDDDLTISVTEETDLTKQNNPKSLFSEFQEVNEGNLLEIGDADITGMSREIENMIKENSDLLETKNALNIVKDDLIAKVDEMTTEIELLQTNLHSSQATKNKFQMRIGELESEMKELKEEMKKMKKSTDGNDDGSDSDDDNVHSKKHFTRSEMVRVLTERNKYKEKFIELQEAWNLTEMMRASKLDSMMTKEATRLRQNQTSNLNNNNVSNGKKPTLINRFFSGLFGASKSTTSTTNNSNGNRVVSVNSSRGFSKSLRRRAESAGPGQHLQTQKLQRASLNTMRGLQSTSHQSPSSSMSIVATPSSDSSVNSTSKTKSLDLRRREQYNTVKAHVKKDVDGRIQAYGWSLPSSNDLIETISNNNQQNVDKRINGNNSPTQTLRETNNITVPVPTYCIPLELDSSSFMMESRLAAATSIDLNGGLTNDLQTYIDCGSKLIRKRRTSFHSNIIPNNNIPVPDLNNMTTLAWFICQTKEHKENSICDSRCVILDTVNPNKIIDSFKLTPNSSVQVIANVRGVQLNDFLPLSCDDLQQLLLDITHIYLKHFIPSSELKLENLVPEMLTNTSSQRSSTSSDFSEIYGTKENYFNHLLTLSTVWIGTQDNKILIHSAIRSRSQPLAVITLSAPIISMLHFQGKMFIGLSNGTIVVFQRILNEEDDSVDKNGELIQLCNGAWDLRSHLTIDICEFAFQIVSKKRDDNREMTKKRLPITCIMAVQNNLWCSYRNYIFIINPLTLKVIHYFEAHPKKDAQIKSLISSNDGVWLSMRLDSTLRLFHAHSYQHLQDIDIGPFITNILGTNRLGLSLIRVSTMMAADNRLWIGTVNGVILNIPLVGKENVIKDSESISSEKTEHLMKLDKGERIPFIDMNNAQFSFHGHRDVVQFFAQFKTEIIESTSEHYLILSGGQGHIDFRVGDDKKNKNNQLEKVNEEESDNNENNTLPSSSTSSSTPKTHNGNQSHIIIWQINTK
ncbi:hypothetical protein SNEBB_003876 [Seison nebaliae]|nr:hypothetical protein SNEBB_003876 [Seison nebaliae]